MGIKIREKVSFYLLSPALVFLVLVGACRKNGVTASANPPERQARSSMTATAQREPNEVFTRQIQNWTHPRSEERLAERERMVEWIQNRYGLQDKKVLDAIRRIPRHWFVPEPLAFAAYTDGPLDIGHDQTISQPFMVAYMTSLLDLDPNDVVLEVGTGSGYQAAVLSEFTPHIFSIEILEPLADTAKARLQERGYRTIHVKHGDGYLGWPEFAPFDAIIVTCAPENIPSPLLEQLAPGGKIVIPVGGRFDIQELYLVTKDEQGNITNKSMMPVRFVPLIRNMP